MWQGRSGERGGQDMKRKLFNRASALSLLVFVATGMLCACGPEVSYRNVWTARRADGYHMLRLDAYRGYYELTMMRPMRPEPIATSDLENVRGWLARLRNDDFAWDGGTYPVARQNPPECLRLYTKSIFPLLFDKLSEEKAFAAAHLLLCGVVREYGDQHDLDAWQPGPGVYFGGLHFKIRPDGKADYDPKQIPALREQWRRFLITPESSTSLSLHPSFFLLLPLIWLWVRLAEAWARRRERLKGCCPTCHYDLTGNSSGVCPECGTAVSEGVEAKA
jgi:hypothetical protein